MKTKQIFIPLIAIFIFSLTACKKDTITEPDPTPTATLSADSNYLSKILYIEKSGNAIDTFIRAFNFDNQKRVITIQDYSLNPTVYEELTNFSYNSNDSLPFKRINISIALNGKRDTSISFLFYNLNGILIKDSAIDYNHISFNSQTVYSIMKGVKNYTYSANKVFGNSVFSIIYDLNGTQNPSTEKDTLTLDANKDVIGRKSKTVYSGTSTSILEFNGSYTYDTKPSHCRALNINNIFPIVYQGADVIYNQQGAKSTRLKSTETFFQNGNSSGTNIFDFTNKYPYKANEFPASALMPYPPSTDYSKLVFIYTTL
jgi:hypothetical protein